MDQGETGSLWEPTTPESPKDTRGARTLSTGNQYGTGNWATGTVCKGKGTAGWDQEEMVKLQSCIINTLYPNGTEEE